jgi:hypothetical protein
MDPISTNLSLSNGIGPRHYPYASFKVDYTKDITNIQGVKLRSKAEISNASSIIRYIII